jgi:1-acyl-sn-glycerol-3-phosphate acyltransferase
MNISAFRGPLAPGEHVRFDQTTARPWPWKGIGGEIYRWIGTAYLKLFRWKMAGDWPDYPKAVAIGAPHTTNLDGPLLIAALGYYRIDMRWMGKASLTKGPLGWFVKWLGCIPIDRSKSNDMVAQMVERFAEADSLIVGVPPEGTRTPGVKWKSGFYHIAQAAGVPIICCVLDWGNRTIRIAGAIMPSGDFEADMTKIRVHYDGVYGKHTPRHESPKAAILSDNRPTTESRRAA